MDNIDSNEEGKEKKVEMEYGTLTHMKMRTQARLSKAIAKKNPPLKEDKKNYKE